MKTFKFEVHCSTTITAEGDTLKNHTDEIINGDCYIDEGREVK